MTTFRETWTKLFEEVETPKQGDPPEKKYSIKQIGDKDADVYRVFQAGNQAAVTGQMTKDAALAWIKSKEPEEEKNP